MDVHEIALLVLVATPALAIVALNVFLFFIGDRDLMLPWPGRRYEPVATPEGRLLETLAAGQREAARDEAIEDFREAA